MKTKKTVLWHIYKNWHIYDRFVILKWQIYDWFMKMTDLWHNYDSFVTDIWLFYANDSFMTNLWQIYDRFMRLVGPTFNKSTEPHNPPSSQELFVLNPSDTSMESTHHLYNPPGPHSREEMGHYRNQNVTPYG